MSHILRMWHFYLIKQDILSNRTDIFIALLLDINLIKYTSNYEHMREIGNVESKLNHNG